MRIWSGIDEAGYGPLLGPLVIVRASVRATASEQLHAAAATADVILKDSKQIHVSGKLQHLERVALSGLRWLSGAAVETAAECFALLGEAASDRAEMPWMAGAEALHLPLAAKAVPNWQDASCQRCGVDGRIVHPAALNAAERRGDNKAVLEAQVVARLLAGIPDDAPADTVVDRLGGRRYYQQVLASIYHHECIGIIDESRASSSYRIDGTHDHHIRFLVDGDQFSPLCSLASCIAKYVRELHMHLFNQYWCGKLRWLGPTAGYGSDAKRWLHQSVVTRPWVASPRIN